MGHILYDWNKRPGWNFQGDPQAIGEHLANLSAESSINTVTPERIVEDARQPESILHPQFEWDDAVAAEEYRLITARNLVGSLVYVEVQEHEVRGNVRAFVQVRDEATRKSAGYAPMVYAMTQQNLRDQVLERAKQEIEAWRRRYADMEEFAELFRVLDEVLPLLVIRDREPA